MITGTTTTRSGLRTRQPCGFFVPAIYGQDRLNNGRVNRAKYNTLRGNKLSRLRAVVETRLPTKQPILLYSQEVAMCTEINLHPEQFISVQNQQAKTTSIKVAEAFGKKHYHVTQKIESLDCSSEFNATNFRAIEYQDAKGRMQSCWEMTKDGFFFLVMGFNGKKAAQIKEAYIQAFNKMEQQLQQKQIPNQTNGRILLNIYDGQIESATLLAEESIIIKRETLPQRIREPHQFTTQELGQIATAACEQMIKTAHASLGFAERVKQEEKH